MTLSFRYLVPVFAAKRSEAQSNGARNFCRAVRRKLTSDTSLPFCEFMNESAVSRDSSVRLKTPNASKVHLKIASVFSLLSFFAIFGVAACSKTNEFKQNEKPGADCDDGQACDGQCVEGVCRAFCDTNYRCPDKQSCIVVNNASVCVPEGTKTYEPYAPLDLLTQCNERGGCEVQLDAPTFEGKFEHCAAGTLTTANVLDSAFDLAGACAGTDQVSPPFYVKGRSAFQIDNGKCREVRAIGAAGPSTLIEACREYYTDAVAFSRVVESGGSTYLWTGGPSPYMLPGSEWWFDLWKLDPNGLSEVAATCEPDTSECSLPTYPRVGAAAGQFAGFWVQCNAQNPADCESDWSASDRHRTAYYIRSDGFGQVISLQSDVPSLRPTSCTSAFRTGPEQSVVILSRHEFPVGEMFMQNVRWAPAPITLPEGEFIGVGSSDGKQFNVTEFYKKVSLPEGFEDPCAKGVPSFKF